MLADWAATWEPAGSVVGHSVARVYLRPAVDLLQVTQAVRPAAHLPDMEEVQADRVDLQQVIAVEQAAAHLPDTAVVLVDLEDLQQDIVEVAQVDHPQDTAVAVVVEPVDLQQVTAEVVQVDHQQDTAVAPRQAHLQVLANHQEPSFYLLHKGPVLAQWVCVAALLVHLDRALDRQVQAVGLV